MKELSAAQSIEIRVNDLCSLSAARGRAVFTPFLNEQELFFAEQLLIKRGDMPYCFWGGDESCLRKMLRVSAYGDEEDFPIFPLTFTFRKADKLEHRDFLGSFMALGIKRELIGDIFTGEGYAAAFCTKTARDVILDGISRIGRVGVKITEGLNVSLPKPELSDITVLAASLRADCIIAGITGLSREKTAEFIKAGNFTLNYTPCLDISKNINSGDIFSLRGYGKFSFSGDTAQTKKGRLRIGLKKYS